MTALYRRSQRPQANGTGSPKQAFGKQHIYVQCALLLGQQYWLAATPAAVHEAGTGLKAAWRLQITGAGLGTRLANSIRSQNFPRSGESLDAAALVWSKAPLIVGAHDTGPLIRSKSGIWLAIPRPAAGKSLRDDRLTPGEWERRRGLRLRFVYRVGVARRGGELGVIL